MGNTGCCTEVQWGTLAAVQRYSGEHWLLYRGTVGNTGYCTGIVPLAAVQRYNGEHWLLYRGTVGNTGCCTGVQWGTLAAVQRYSGEHWQLYRGTVGNTGCCTEVQWGTLAAVQRYSGEHWLLYRGTLAAVQRLASIEYSTKHKFCITNCPTLGSISLVNRPLTNRSTVGAQCVHTKLVLVQEKQHQLPAQTHNVCYVWCICMCQWFVGLSSQAASHS